MKKSNRGYALIFVLVLGVVLATLSSILLYATSRDNTEARLQSSTARAVYAAEGGVAVGIERVRAALETNPQPNLTLLETPAPTLPGVTFENFRIRYFNKADGTATSIAPTTPVFAQIASGPNRGLFASQTPIQVLATAVVGKARASVADAIRVDLIPIFQFAIFMDGDFELQNPAAIAISGRVHTNGDFYLSNGQTIEFRGPVTIAGDLHNASSFNPGTTRVGANLTSFLDSPGSGSAFLRDTPVLPEAVSANQAAYLLATFGDNVRDQSSGQERLSVPISISGFTSCTTTCSAGFNCVRKNPADATGFCMPVVISRPDVCGTGGTATAIVDRPNFTQSLGIELIRRPDGAYDGSPYNVTGTPVRSTSANVADFGPNFAAGADDTAATDMVAAGAEDLVVARHVPVTNVDKPSDNPGAANERFYWKADIRIIDGIWYKKGSNNPVFDPENWDMSTGPLDFDDANTVLGHKFARVLRYSWFWDPRETRILAANSYQRGMQMRTSDFDVAAFNALLEDATARNLLFPLGVVPAQGMIIYMSETYDATFEDLNTVVVRSPNVRNFLNTPYMENDTAQRTIAAGNRFQRVATDFTPAAPNRAIAAKRPDELGWFSENIWGAFAPANFRSLTPQPTGATGSVTDPRIDLTSANTIGAGAAFECQEPALLVSPPIPATRPDAAARAAGSFRAPCIQSGATPLGPENAVRIIRAQTMPLVGLTFATDNRLYIVGDVNVVTANPTGANVTGRTMQDAAGNVFNTLRDIPGKISFVADSITILSARFSDRFMQRGGDPANEDNALSTQARFSLDAAGFAGPWSLEAPAEDAGAGAAPNLCTLSRTGLGNMPGTWPAAFAAGAAAEMFGGASPRSVRTGLPFRINASLLMGDVPPCMNSSGSVGNASGGVNNFPRYLEILGGQTFNVINGSMVSLFRAERGNSRFLTSGFDQDTTASNDNWRGGATDGAGIYTYDDNPCVYVPPRRLWSFDPSLQDPANLPPGTPRVFANERIRWVRR